MKKLLILISVLIFLSGCATKLASERTKAQQQEVKEKVIKTLEDYYKQPFKIIDFNYKYETSTSPQNDCVFLYCKTSKIGVYHFKIQAVDNPIIIMDFELIDNKNIFNMNKDDKKEEYSQKESIKQNLLLCSN